jgi:protein gp37
MADLFGDWISNEWIFKIMQEVEKNPQWTFIFLTKRPENVEWFWRPPWPNAWLGVSCENQARADERIPILLQIPAAMRFVSLEPMLGPVDLRFCDEFPDADGCYEDARHGIDWVIPGGESGPGARPLHPDWVRSVRDQCQAAGVPFFFKGWGEYSYELREYGPDGENWIDKNEYFRNHVGKKVSGRLLDGRTWEEYPK